MYKGEMDMWKESIQIEGPYNFDLVLERISLDPLHEIDPINRLIKVPLLIDGKPIRVQGTGGWHR